MSAAVDPQDGDHVTIGLPTAMLDELDARAAAAGLTRDQVIVALLERGLRVGPHDGVDRTQIAHRLQMTPAERIRTMAAETRRLLAIQAR